MPIRLSDLQYRGLIGPRRPVSDEKDMRFGDLVYMLAESIAEAQTKLDLETAEVLTTLAEERVEIVPTVTRHIDAEGNVTYESAPPVERSLLELGFTPSRYQFNEATVELDFDLRISEEETSDSEGEERTYGLYAGTYDVQEERKYQRDVTATSKLSATLVPTPLPVNVSPTESVEGPDSEEEPTG